MTRAAFADHIRKYKSIPASAVPAFDAFADAMGFPRAEGKADPLTVRICLELVGHEAIVQEAYKDSVGVWTWGIGIATTSGFDVMRYKDNPQPVAVCLKAFVDLVRAKYLPAVLKAFDGFPLTEAQLAAALSFHYNTGAISRASWVGAAKAGNPSAKAAFMEWRKPAAIIERRQKECALFFDGKWSQDGRATIYPVRKPSYTPNWSAAKRVNIEREMAEALA